MSEIDALDSNCRASGTSFEEFSEGELHRNLIRQLAEIDCPNPYFLVHEETRGSLTNIGGRELVNFSAYDYLGLNRHVEVLQAAKRAIDTYGVSPMASRLVAGERDIHGVLERKLARHFNHDGCLSFVSGYGTNVSVLASLAGPGDIIFCDELAHNSILMGAKLSGAKMRRFRHNDLDDLEEKLTRLRGRHRRAYIVAEGLYSMDGDICDLRHLVALKRRYDARLIIDDAHGMGVLGAEGRGVFQEAGMDPAEIDVWIGTLSKALASTGGFVVGSTAMIDYLKTMSGGFVFSVALAPVMAAAALAAYDILMRSPDRVQTLRANSRAFLTSARNLGLDTGPSVGAGIVPIIIGDSMRALRLSSALVKRGVNVQPIVYPGVAEGEGRLRFFITANHTLDQIRGAVEVVAEELDLLTTTATPNGTLG